MVAIMSSNLCLSLPLISMRLSKIFSFVASRPLPVGYPKEAMIGLATGHANRSVKVKMDFNSDSESTTGTLPVISCT